MVYPANEVLVAGVGESGDRGGGVVSGSLLVWRCGGSWTGTPVREWRRGGIVASDCDVGVRMRRRRGLAMCLTFGLEGVSGGSGCAEVMVDLCWLVETVGSFANGVEGRFRGRVWSREALGGVLVGRACPRTQRKAAEMTISVDQISAG